MSKTERETKQLRLRAKQQPLTGTNPPFPKPRVVWYVIMIVDWKAGNHHIEGDVRGISTFLRTRHNHTIFYLFAHPGAELFRSNDVYVSAPPGAPPVAVCPPIAVCMTFRVTFYLLVFTFTLLSKVVRPVVSTRRGITFGRGLHGQTQPTCMTSLGNCLLVDMDIHECC